MPSNALAEFRAMFGTPGDDERRTVPLARAVMKATGSDGRLKVTGHASVFNSPSVEMKSHAGSFVEYIASTAFNNVLARKPDVLLTIDHDSRWTLARTGAGNLELSTNQHGLRFYATCSDTSYARDLRELMNDNVITQSSFLFRIAPGGEEWTIAENDRGTVVRVIHEVGELYDVCITAHGAYPATDSGIARSIMLDYALERGLLTSNPDLEVAKAKTRALIVAQRAAL